jgi:hypothetical protein
MTLIGSDMPSSGVERIGRLAVTLTGLCESDSGSPVFDVLHVPSLLRRAIEYTGCQGASQDQGASHHQILHLVGLVGTLLGVKMASEALLAC